MSLVYHGYVLKVLRAAPGVHRLIVEALLDHLLPEERADTYRHKEIRSTDRLTYPVRFSWSCLAGSHPAEVYEPTSRNRNAAYSQQKGPASLWQRCKSSSSPMPHGSQVAHRSISCHSIRILPLGKQREVKSAPSSLSPSSTPCRFDPRTSRTG